MHIDRRHDLLWISCSDHDGLDTQTQTHQMTIITIVIILTIWTKYCFMKSTNTPPARIKNTTQWHAWIKSRRQALEHRIWQAERAEWNWPSTRRGHEVMHLKNELEELNAQEFVSPGSKRVFNTATAVWPPQPA